MRLILVRHGESERNRERITLGRADVPLNARGHAQAAALAASFTTPPAAIYSSPLVRTAATAEAIAEATGVAVTTEPALIEMDIGEMENLTRTELRERHPGFLAKWLSADAADARMPGGETLLEVQGRAWAWVDATRGRHPDGQVVAVTHNFVILTLLCRALDLPLAQFRRLRHGLAARSMLDITDSSSALLQLNDQCHLIAAGLAADDLIGREARA